jgi:hypothetical protein
LAQAVAVRAPAVGEPVAKDSGRRRGGTSCGRPPPPPPPPPTAPGLDWKARQSQEGPQLGNASTEEQKGIRCGTGSEKYSGRGKIVCGEELKTRVRLGVLIDNAIAKLIQQMHTPKGTYKERLHCGLQIYTAPAVAPPLQDRSGREKADL